MFGEVSKLLVSLLVAVGLGLGAGEPALAQFEGEGRVIGLDTAAATVTLDHGPIPGLMPPMRMRFSVQSPEQLGKLKVGDRVRFSLGSRGDEVTIVTIERLDPPKP